MPTGCFYRGRRLTQGRVGFWIGGAFIWVPVVCFFSLSKLRRRGLNLRGNPPHPPPPAPGVPAALQHPMMHARKLQTMVTLWPWLCLQATSAHSKRISHVSGRLHLLPVSCSGASIPIQTAGTPFFPATAADKRLCSTTSSPLIFFRGAAKAALLWPSCARPGG